MKLYGVTGWKNAGKTGLMERLVAEFTGRGLSVSTLKHAHHHFDLDPPGKDSRRHRDAGARQVMLASRHRWALLSELRDDDEPPLSALLARLDPDVVAGALETSGALGSLFKGKKAKYWEVYESMYKEIAKEAEDEFYDLFGKEFSNAYQNQIKKL